MAEPVLRNEGNLRFAGQALPGYPDRPDVCATEVRSFAVARGATPHGPPVMLFTMPPYDHPRTWECQCGVAITGLMRAGEGISVEDYRGLHALSLAHVGAITAVAETHRRLVEHGRSLGHAVRPYWRLSLWRRRLADGNVLPAAEVSVFLDRW